MTAFEKLEYLREYMDLWIDCRINDSVWEMTFWRLFNECGILLSPSLLEKRLPTFEQFLKLKQII